MNSDLFEMAIRNLAVRWKKCEAAEGHYFEGRKLEIYDISEAEVTSEESATEPDSDATVDDESDWSRNSWVTREEQCVPETNTSLYRL